VDPRARSNHSLAHASTTAALRRAARRVEGFSFAALSAKFRAGLRAALRRVRAAGIEFAALDARFRARSRDDTRAC